MFELISHCYKTCLDRCDDFSLSLSLTVITLCPPTSFPQLSISPCCRCNPILPHTPFTSTPHFIFPGLYVLNFRRPHHGIMASSSDSSCFGPYNDLNFCTKYSYTGQILNSRSESCVFWLLSDVKGVVCGIRGTYPAGVCVCATKT
jgi:hypothetical protein